MVIGVSLLKLLLMPYYTSTDFEVHRNWLAITHSLPVDKWYTEATSEWTLDYPPFFAWFECLLSQFAAKIDPKMLDVHNLNYKSFETLAFQRLSVIVTDLVLAFGVHVCAGALKGSSRIIHQQDRTDLADHLAALVLTNAGLLMIDHVHFQYNGVLLGLLLASIGYMLSHKYLKSALLFVVLLNMKHIFLYCAPAYFVYLLASFCNPSRDKLTTCIANLVGLGSIVIAGFGLSLGPFVYHGKMGDLLARLFPFKRGLTHAYWAPNFWALYSAVDRASVMVAKALNPKYVVPADAKVTSGLVQDSVFANLPQVPPAVTFAVTAAFLVPVFVRLWQSPKQPMQFVRALILCSFTSYMFGWHVHEKAILLVSVPWTLLAVANPGSREAKIFVVLSTMANFSIFPLLFRNQETLVKLFLLLFHLCVCVYFNAQHKSVVKRRVGAAATIGGGGGGNGSGDSSNGAHLPKWYEWLYVAGSVGVFAFPYVAGAIWCPSMLHKYEFLPLMLYSVYCTIGNIYAFSTLYLNFLFS